MTAASIRVSEQPFDNSGWARLAGFLLIGWGIAVGIFGSLIIVNGFLYDDSGRMGYGELAIIIGTGILVAGLIHVVAGASVLRHRSWARALGLVVGILGGMLALAILPTAFNTVYLRGVDDQTVAAGPELRSVIIGLSVVPYALIVLGLLLGGRQFRRQNQPQSSRTLR